MEDEKWQKVRETFDLALRRKPEERPKFVREVCGGDETLLAEVESLLASLDGAENFMETPAVAKVVSAFEDETKALERGKSFGHYEVIEQIGAGGMGEVYLARDKKLDRRVAIKILNERFSRDESNLQRFVREAKSASGLNHPNILVIHEIGESDGAHYIVSEFIKGVTLREIFKEKKLKLSEALDIAIQTAKALCAAHEAGLIHRDIKPENIMIRPDRLVKILDFGLAKLVEQKKQSVFGLEQSTVKQNETAKGVILGTINYMSPEQAKGEQVDEQTDVFSFGVLLYEMIAGRTPFAGDSTSETFANLIKTEPLPLSSYAANVPEELQRIVSKTLRKNKDERYQTMRDLLRDLQEFREHSVNVGKIGRIASTSNNTTNILQHTTADLDKQTAVKINYGFLRQIKNKPALSISAALILIAAASSGYWFFLRGKTIDAPLSISKTSQITNWTGLDFYPAISPDGNTVAFSSDRTGGFEIYVKQLVAGAKEVQITSDGQQNFQPAFSPDGGLLAYHSNNRGGIWIVPLTGGAPKQLTEFGSHPSFSPDGKTIAFSESDSIAHPSERNGNAPQTLWLVSLQGGEPRRLTEPNNPAGGHAAPAFSPDGKRIVFDTNDPSFSEVWSVSADGGDLKKLSGNLYFATDAVYAPDGESVFFVALSGSSLWQVNVSPTGAGVGEPVKIYDASNSRIRNLSIAAKARRIAYSAMTLNSNLRSMAVTPTGEAAANAEVVNLTQYANRRNRTPVFSPDGRRIAYTAFDEANHSQIWMTDSDGKNQTQLTSSDEGGISPSWFPDGKRIAFHAGREQNNVSSVTIEGAKVKKLFDLDDSANIVRLSPDGKQFAFTSTRGGATNVWLGSSNGGEMKQLTFENGVVGFPAWSPDGKWIAFQKLDASDQQIAVVPSAGGAASEQLTFDRGFHYSSDWSPDSSKILFAGNFGGVWNIYWISRLAKQRKQLTNFTKLNSYVRSPSWSPSGNQIVFEYAETNGNIWMIELK